jgi:hypothetical protein
LTLSRLLYSPGVGQPYWLGLPTWISGGRRRTHSPVRVIRRRHRATRACASASYTRDRLRLPNQSDPRGHYGRYLHHRPDRCRASPLPRRWRANLTSCRSGASLEVSSRSALAGRDALSPGLPASGRSRFGVSRFANPRRFWCGPFGARAARAVLRCSAEQSVVARRGGRAGWFVAQFSLSASRERECSTTSSITFFPSSIDQRAGEFGGTDLSRSR